MTPETATAGLCFAGSALALALALRPRRRHPAARLDLVPKGKRLVNTVPVGQSLLFRLVSTDASGNPDATLANPAAVASSDPAVFTVGADTLAVGATLTVTGVKPGTATLTVTGGALTASAEVTVTSGPAVSIALVPVPG